MCVCVCVFVERGFNLKSLQQYIWREPELPYTYTYLHATCTSLQPGACMQRYTRHVNIRAYTFRTGIEQLQNHKQTNKQTTRAHTRETLGYPHAPAHILSHQVPARDLVETSSAHAHAPSAVMIRPQSSGMNLSRVHSSPPRTMTSALEHLSRATSDPVDEEKVPEHLFYLFSFFAGS